MASNPSAVDQLLQILGHSYRRHALAILADANNPITIRDVTNGIVSRDYTAQLQDVPSDDIMRVYLSLVHIHIPMLRDADLIEYDPTRELIEETDLSDVQPLLSEMGEDQLEPAQ